MALDQAFRILLIEDNPLDARAVERALRRPDDSLHLVHVDTLAKGVEAGSTQAFDAILLDLSLPDSEGLDSLATLLEAAPATPVIVLTGLDDPEVAVAAVERGAQDFLTKATISPELIERALRYAVARHHSELELRQANALVDSMHTREEIARDLHDTVIQRLFAIGMSLQAAGGADDVDHMRPRVLRAVDEIDDSIRELRQAIFGLNQAPATHDQGEPKLLIERVEAIVDHYRHAGLDVHYDLPAGLPLDDGVEHDLMSILEEAISNTVQHASAANLTIEADIGDERVVVTVTDDGIGVTGRDRTEGGASLRGNGLTNMTVRAERNGGSCRIEPAPGGGTRVSITLPR